MGGNTFTGTSPVGIDLFNAFWPDLRKTLEGVGLRNITWVGTTGKKPLMGDIDLAAEYDDVPRKLINDLQGLYGRGCAKKSGGALVALCYPITSTTHCQVDLMLGHIDFLTWARWAPSPVVGHLEYSRVKGVIRNVLLGTVMQHVTKLLLPGQQDELDRTRYVIDFDNGLSQYTQTRRNKTAGNPPTKEWKTLNKRLITHDTSEILRFIFEEDVDRGKTLRFEDFINVIRGSERFSASADVLFQEFIEGLHFADKRVVGNLDELLQTLKEIM